MTLESSLYVVNALHCTEFHTAEYTRIAHEPLTSLYLRCLQANILRMPRQLEYFREYKERVSSLVGEEEMDRLVKGALVLIVLGGNDFVNNYYLVPYSLRSLRYSLPDYVRLVISEYKKILMVTCFHF